jgi:hypothetical protein
VSCCLLLAFIPTATLVCHYSIGQVVLIVMRVMMIYSQTTVRRDWQGMRKHQIPVGWSGKMRAVLVSRRAASDR